MPVFWKVILLGHTALCFCYCQVVVKEIGGYDPTWLTFNVGIGT